MCQGVGYNATGMPNLGDQDRQNDALITLRSFQPLIDYGCSAQLKFFLCSVYVPMCTDKVANPIGPCRSLCEKVRSKCYPVLQGFGFRWPLTLNCSRFPTENNHEHMCMEGPSEMSAGFTSLTSYRHVITPQGPTPCSKLTKSSQYMYINRSGRCVPFCNADVLFDTADKNFAEVWLSIWTTLSFVSTIVALLSFLVGSSAWGRYPENSLVFLTLCYCLVSVGWGIRSLAGRTAVSCKSDSSVPERLLLADDGFGNANCTIVFFLLYYFGMAAIVWWVVACFCWTVCSGLQWTQDRLQGLSSMLHFAAWGIPTAHTLTVFVRRDADAEELTGICYVGGQNLQTLLWLVLIPHAVCLLAGVVILITGAILVCRKPRNAPRAPATVQTTHTTVRNRNKPAPDLLKLGVFALLYTIPLGCLVASYSYEFWGRSKWILGNGKPALWIFLLRIFMSLVVGITSAMWVWNPHTVLAWRQFLSRFIPRPGYHQPPVKCQQPLPVLRYVVGAQPAISAPGSAVLQPLTGGAPSGRHSSRSHKHRGSQRSSHHLRYSGSETIL